MTDAAFFAAILADPDDRTLTQVYADWLEERGDPRGEFVRLQAELARMERNDPRRGEREPRLWELLERLMPLPNVLIEPRAFSVPAGVIEVMPDNIARENIILPLNGVWREDSPTRRGTNYLSAVTFVTTLPHSDTDLMLKLQFILNCRVELLPGRHERIQAEIDHYYTNPGESDPIDTPEYWEYPPRR